MKDKTLPPELSKIELHSDAWPRFEKLMSAVAKAKAGKSKPKASSRAKRASAKKRAPSA